jgi:muramoyltetrapeptide carboxypeptidase
MTRGPRPITPGARVGLFAASSPFAPERFERGLAALARLGFVPVIPDGLTARHGYLAGDDAHRLAQLERLLDDPAIDAVLAVRGGYGLHRLLDRLDPQRIARAGKWIVGFSDVTALHAAARRVGLGSAHAPVLTQLGELGPEAEQAFVEVLAGPRASIAYAPPTPLALDALRGPDVAGGTLERAWAETRGRAHGVTFGGCLSVLAPLVGTPHLPDLDGTILLLEDVGETPYRLDRLLTQLLASGALRGVRGFAIGELVGCTPRTDDEPSAEAVVLERLAPLGRPIVFGLPFGHGSHNRAIALGAPATLDADAGTLTVAPYAANADDARADAEVCA